MGDEGFITCNSLVKIYRLETSEVQALQGLDLRVARGELMAIVGPSGSGKSTLMNILGGLDSPTGGKVVVGGRDIGRLSPAALDVYRSREVGFVWQKPSRNLLPYLTARENVELPVVMTGRATGQTRRRAEELLGLVGLGDRQRHTLVQLSGGELQRVAIATALIHAPILLLADEPTGELDSATSQAILRLLRDLNRDLGITTMIVTHDASVTQQVDRVVAIRDGKTSTEKVRAANHGPGAVAGQGAADSGVDGSGLDGPGLDGPQAYREYVVLDSAGRLQIPKEMRESLGMRGRAELDLVEDGVLVRPVPPSGDGSADAGAPPVDEAGRPPARPKASGAARRFLGFLRRRGAPHDARHANRTAGPGDRRSQVLHRGADGNPCASGRGPGASSRHLHRAHGTVRLREDHASEPPGWPGHSHHGGRALRR